MAGKGKLPEHYTGVPDAFVKMLDDIDACRRAGFLRPALAMALCVPDFCRKRIGKTYLYNDWCRDYGGALLQQFADELYAARNSTLHEMTPRMSRLLDFGPEAARLFPVQVTPVFVPGKYQTVNAGALISELLAAGHKFYERAGDDLKDQMDTVDDYFIEDVSELFWR